MGTRATVKFYNEEPKKGVSPFLNCYYQYDGYYSGVGKAISDFLKSKTIINGIGRGETLELGFANGIGCLAAQYVSKEKVKIGGFYIEDISLCESYDYLIWVDFETNKIFMIVDEFKGEPKDFDNFISNQETED